MAQGDVEATLQRISSHKGVLGCIIVNSQGAILRTTCEPEIAELHAHLIPQLAGLARNLVRDLDPQPCAPGLASSCLYTLQSAILQHELSEAVVYGSSAAEQRQNDLEFLRIRSYKHEIMVAPNPDFVLIVIQDPSVEA